MSSEEALKEVPRKTNKYEKKQAAKTRETKQGPRNDRHAGDRPLRT